MKPDVPAEVPHLYILTVEEDGSSCLTDSMGVGGGLVLFYNRPRAKISCRAGMKQSKNEKTKKKNILKDPLQGKCFCVLKIISWNFSHDEEHGK